MTAPDFDTDAAMVVAKALASATADPEAGALDWDDLDAKTQAEMQELGLHAIQAFVGYASAQGVRMVSAKAVAIPESDEEAAAMMAAVRVYTDAKGRKSKLVGSVAPGLVVPAGVKPLNGKAH